MKEFTTVLFPCRYFSFIAQLSLSCYCPTLTKLSSFISRSFVNLQLAVTGRLSLPIQGHQEFPRSSVHHPWLVASHVSLIKITTVWGSKGIISQYHINKNRIIKLVAKTILNRKRESVWSFHEKYHVTYLQTKHKSVWNSLHTSDCVVLCNSQISLCGVLSSWTTPSPT